MIKQRGMILHREGWHSILASSALQELDYSPYMHKIHQERVAYNQSWALEHDWMGWGMARC